MYKVTYPGTYDIPGIYVSMKGTNAEGTLVSGRGVSYPLFPAISTAVDAIEIYIAPVQASTEQEIGAVVAALDVAVAANLVAPPGGN